MDGIFDKKSDLMKEMDAYFKRVKAIHKLPEYAEFLKYKEEVDQFKEFIDLRRIEKTYEFIQSIIESDISDMMVKDWLERIKHLEKALSDSAWNRRESFCSSNIMDHIWEVVKKYGHPVEAEDMFDQEAFVIGKYTMAVYSGQGEYGYSISVKNRIF